MTEWTNDELWHAFERCVSVPHATRSLRILGAVHPVDVREREGAAFVHGCEIAWKEYTEKKHHFDYPTFRNTLYPSLIPAPSPPLVLDGGTWTARMSKGKRSWAAGDRSTDHICPPIDNASDARKLADWLAKYGTEEEKR